MTDTVPALTRALDVVERIAYTLDGMSYRELRAATDVPPASLTRILGVLVERGYLGKAVHGAYRLGPRLFAVGAIAGQQMDILALAAPVLRQLRDDTQETAELGIPVGTELVIAAQVESERSLRLFAQVGYRFSRLHISGSGKAVLAFAPDAFLEKYLASADWTAATPKTITASTALRQELTAARRNGYAWDDGEAREDVRRFAAPVFDAAGALAAVIGLAGPAFRMPLKRRPEFGFRVKAAATELSRCLGNVAGAADTRLRQTRIPDR